MSYFKTAILLAGLTALFMGVGYLIGGAGGAMVALIVAAATNLFAYWNSDRMVLSMNGAQEVDERSAPDLVRLVAVIKNITATLHDIELGIRHEFYVQRLCPRRGDLGF